LFDCSQYFTFMKLLTSQNPIDSMKQLPGEEKLITSNGNKVILTNYRIQMSDSELGKSYLISIFLEDISSIEVKYKSNIIFIIIGIVALLAGAYLDKAGPGAILCCIFIAIWWFSRQHIISISSNGGAALNFLVTGMSETNINDFVDNVSNAKHARVAQLNKC
jgi:hypothetical protein